MSNSLLFVLGFRIPKKGGKILIGIQEDFQPRFLPTAKKLSELGYQVIANTIVWMSVSHYQHLEYSCQLHNK